MPKVSTLDRAIANVNEKIAKLVMVRDELMDLKRIPAPKRPRVVKKADEQKAG